jgi:hypothetical protein
MATMILKITKVALLGMLGPLMAGLGFLVYTQHVNVRRFAIRTPNGIQVSKYVQSPHVLAAGREKIGFVLDLNGTWFADGSPVRKGQAVEAGAIVSLSPQTRFDSGEIWNITIILLSNKLVKRSCSTFDTCHSPLPLPSSMNQSPPALARMWDAVSRLIFAQPDRYASTIARGQEQQGIALPDAVVKLEAGRVLLTPVLKDVPARHLLLRVQRYMETNNSADVRMIPLDWRPGQTASVNAAGLSPGIYKLRLFDADQPLGQPISEVAWILLETSARYQSSFNEFEQASSLTRDWEAEVTSQDKRAFLRACLDHLAKETPRR